VIVSGSLVALLCGWAPAATADSNLGSLAAQRAALQSQVGGLGTQQAEELQRLLEVQDRLADLRRQMARNQADLVSLQSRRDDLLARIGTARGRMATERRAMGALARERYKVRNDYQPDQLFFATSSLGDMVNRLVASRAMSQRAHSLMGELHGVEQALSTETAELSRRQAEVQQLQSELAGRKAAMQTTAADYRSRLDSLNASSADLLRQIQSINSQIAAANRPPSAGYRPSQQEVIAIIRAAAKRFNQDGDRLVRVARCESGLNPRAYDAASGASGLFQFMPGTFYGNGGHDIWDAADQSNIAAKMFSQGRSNAWSCK
jgi:septal ring factor EnvC (AmiA/AmiB activator)